VLHTEANAHKKLDAFRRSTEPWIVAVNMVSEGVDIPRLRVGVYSTVAKTPLIFRQIVGRFVRVVPGRPTELAWVFLPADRGLRTLAADVETELRHSLRPSSDGGVDDGLLDDDLLERAARTETEPGEAPFVPLAADVAPQMALFGSPDPPSPAPTMPSALAPPAGAFPSAVRSPKPEPRRRAAPVGLRAARGPARPAPRARRDAAAHRRPLVQRDQRVAQPPVRRPHGRGGDDRPAREVDRAPLQGARPHEVQEAPHRGGALSAYPPPSRQRRAPRSRTSRG
jgi:hypothetical protein